MVNYISVYGGSGYGMAYSWGDTIYAFGIFLAMCMFIAGYIIQCHREGFSVYEQPKIFIILGFFGIIYAVFIPLGGATLITLIFIYQYIGHHGQWIAIAITNFAAWIFFWYCMIPSTFRQNHV